MTRITSAFWLLVAGALFDQAAVAGVRYFDISGSTATAENACPAWVPANNQDDCSYNASNPSTAGTEQWIGPVFGAGYYAPGDAPAVFTNPVPASPVTAPAPELPLGGKTGIPIARGFISINDNGTPEGTDDVIGGTIQFGPFQRNVATGPSTRMIESFDRIIHRIVPPTANTSNVNAATPNGDGGIDYVIGLAGTAAAFPPALSGSTTAAGGVTDSFPSQVASQSSDDADDVSYWSAPRANGIARFEGATGLSGLRTTATVWGYTCSAGPGAPPCVTSEVNWNADSRARFDNVLLSLSTDDAGHITAASAYLVNQSDLSRSVAGDDSWSATTLAFTGTEDLLPAAFDDRAVFINTRDLAAVITPLLNDVPGVAPVTVTIATPPAHGSAVVLTQPANSVNVIQYTPTAGPAFEGVDTFTYLITDANNETATGTVAVTLTSPVTCTADAPIGAVNAPTTIDVLANDAGFDIPPVLVAVLGAPTPGGTAITNPDGTITFTPPTDATGFFTFEYRVDDGAFEPAQCTVTVNVDGTVAVDDDADVEDFVTVSIPVLDNDIRQVLVAPIEIEITQAPAHGEAQVLPAAGTQLATIRYSSNAGYAGPDSIGYRLRDAVDFVSNEATVGITVSDAVPHTDPDTSTAEDGEQTSIFVTINDDDGLDVPLTLTITSPPTHGTATVVPGVGSTPSFIDYTPAAGFVGTDMLTYTLTDADGDVSNPSIVTITVEDSVPHADDDPTNNGNARTEQAFHVMANDDDKADTPITIEITQPPGAGTARVIPASATTTGEPAIGYASDPGSNGPDSLRYRLRDADGDVSNEATVTINVTDETPVANPDANISLEDGTSLGIAILDNDTGLVNAPYRLTITQQPANGSATINTGTALAKPIITYKAKAGFVGSDTFRYLVTDGDGDASNEAVVTLTVSDAVPVATPDTGNGDSRTSTAFDVLSNDTNLNDSPVTIEITGQPTNGTAELVNISLGTRTRPGIGYASDVNFSGSDVVRYQITDQDGDVSNETTLTLTVANPTPVAVNDVGGDQGLLGAGQTYVVERLETAMDVLHNDTGRGNRPNTIIITQQPQHGTAVVDSEAVTGLGRPGISYTGNDGYTGPDTFSYTVTDADSQVSNVATVTFEVVNVLTATPDGSPFPLATTEGTPLIVNVLENDGGLAVGPITIEIVTEVSGTATVNADNTVTFQPAPGFTGRFPSPDCPPSTCPSSVGGGFRYRITDGLNQQSEASSFVDVFPSQVTEEDNGGSAFDAGAIALLLAGLGWKDRQRRLMIH